MSFKLQELFPVVLKIIVSTIEVSNLAKCIYVAKVLSQLKDTYASIILMQYWLGLVTSRIMQTSLYI
jgi:hypothetical protein